MCFVVVKTLRQHGFHKQNTKKHGFLKVFLMKTMFFHGFPHENHVLGWKTMVYRGFPWENHRPP